MKLSTVKQSFLEALDSDYDGEEVLSFFYQLIEEFLGEQRFVLHLKPDFEIDDNEALKFEKALEDLKSHIPIQYILGYGEFMSLRFKVNSSVLIPRPETEDLICYLDSYLKKREVYRILDIGTGSGCIGISLKHKAPRAQVSLMDVSKEALKTAEENAKINDLEVELLQEDVLNITTLKNSYDLIVSNPPYIRNLEKEAMRPNVLNHEPHLALFVSNEDPLLFYRKIAMLAKDHLNLGGMLCFEINEAFGEETVALLDELEYKQIELINDRFGKNRIVSAIR